MRASVLWVGRGRNNTWSRLLSASGYEVVEARDLSEALPLIDSLAPHVVLVERADHGLTEVLGHAAGERAARVVAVVAASDHSAVGGADAAFAAGAHDALRDDADAEEVRLRLHAWTRTATHERQQVRSLQAMQHRLDQLELENVAMRELAHRDELTGLGNRRSFRTQLDYAIEYAARYGGVVSVVLGDLDGMKRLNDDLGHPAGDAALRRVGELFRTTLRGTDHAARIGGDEFGVVMPTTPGSAAAMVADRIRVRVGELPMVGGTAYGTIVGISFGVATLINPRGIGFASDDLIARADAALYLAKRSGRDRVEIDGEESVRAA